MNQPAPVPSPARLTVAEARDLLVEGGYDVRDLTIDDVRRLRDQVEQLARYAVAAAQGGT